jgi:hypothetical protein
LGGNGEALPADDLPLFLAASRRERNTLPRAARIIAARYALPPAIAATVASLAGFGGRNDS